MPVPAGYEVLDKQEGDHHIYLLQLPKQEPDLAIYSGFAPELTEGGKRCSAEIAGETVRGTMHPSEHGGMVRDFILERGVAGAAFHILVREGPATELMLQVLKGLVFHDQATAAGTETPVPAAPEPANAETATRTFKCYGSFTLPLPSDIRVLESAAAGSYRFHFIAPGDRLIMLIYSGHNPETQVGGSPVTATIAGQQVEGSTLTGKHDIEARADAPPAAPAEQDRKGEEYLLPMGADGAVYHIIVYDGPHKSRALGMLAAMSIKAGSALSESTRQQIEAAAKNSAALLAKANRLLATVTDRATADAAVAELDATAKQLAEQDKALEALTRKYGKGVSAYMSTLEKPSDSKGSEQEIQRVDEQGCFGSTALRSVLNSLMGMDGMPVPTDKKGKKSEPAPTEPTHEDVQPLEEPDIPADTKLSARG